MSLLLFVNEKRNDYNLHLMVILFKKVKQKKGNYLKLAQ